MAMVLAQGLAGAAPGKLPAAPAAPAAAVAPAPVDAETLPVPGSCGEGDKLPPAALAQLRALEPGTADPRQQLQELAQQALQRSQALGAANLLAQAARADWEEAKAARLPQLNLGGSLVHAGSKTQDYPLQSGPKASVNLSVSAPIFDAGRNVQLANWRAQLAEGARLGLLSTEQQLVLQTVSLSMDRGRYQLQAKVYVQYVGKMRCLVEALGTIVKADRGRASELVQAQKTQQQAELALLQTLSTLRQVEGRLRRLVGDDLPPGASYGALLTQVPELSEMQRDAEQAPDIVALDAQARAQSSYAASVAAAYKPQVSLLLGSTASAIHQAGDTRRSGEWVAGVSLNMPLYNAGSDHSISAARLRSEAARLQRDEQLEVRRYRMLDMHEAATSSFERARLIVETLRNSERVRASTLQQWAQLGRRSLFDVMGAEADYYSLRVAQVNALVDGQQSVALLWSLGRGVLTPLQ